MSTKNYYPPRLTPKERESLRAEMRRDGQWAKKQLAHRPKCSATARTMQCNCNGNATQGN